MVRKFCGIIILLSCVFSSYASKVQEFEFEGLKRTSRSFIENELSSCIGLEADDVTKNKIETILQAEGLFTDISIEFLEKDEESACAKISVSEKISFMPVPFFMYTSGSGFMGGGVVMDMNAFGRGDMFMAGGFFSGSKKLGITAFVKRPVNYRPGFSLSASFGKLNNEIKNLSDKTVFDFDCLSFSAGGSLNEKIGEYVTVGLGGRYSFSDPENSAVCSFINRGKFLELTESVSASVMNWNGYFMSVHSLNLNVSQGHKIDGENFQTYKGTAAFAQPVISKIRITASLAGFYGKNLDLSFYSKRDELLCMILPDDLRFEKGAAASCGTEIAVVKIKYGLVSAFAQYQAAVIEDFDGDCKREHGIYGGIRLYLSKLAFPAVGLGVSYNITENFWQGSAALGFAF